MRYLVLAAVVFISGCQTDPAALNYTERQKLSEEFVQRCVKQGVSVNDPRMEACFGTEMQREFALRRQRQQALASIGDAVAETGNDMQRNADARMRDLQARRPIDCRSQYLGAGASRTTCQ